MNLEGYAVFRRTVANLTGIDLDSYKSTQLERRLQEFCAGVGLPDLAQYSRLLQTDKQRVEEFKDFLTINVTEFFRNPDKYKELKEKVLPELMRQTPRLRIWSAGCSTGAEPYSVAIVLHELDPARQHEILATDLDAGALATARAGVFQERDVKEVSPERRARYFTQEPRGWVVRPEIRARVRFEQHNLLADPFPSGFDLILCRNVVIYFSEDAKTDLYRKFHQALRPDGGAFVGGTESLLRARELGFATLLPFFYRAVK